MAPTQPRVRRIAGQAFDCNIYLLEGDRPAVVDAGTGGATAFYAKRIKVMLGDRRADRLVLTHRHYDHSGGAATLARELGAEVFIHEAGVAAMAGGDAEESGAWLFGGELERVDASPLREGDVVDTGAVRWEVLHTPGHSPDAIALWDAEAKALVPGDTVYADGGVGRWDLAGGDHRKLVASIERLAGLGAESMYPGHGPSVEGGATDHILMGLRTLRTFGGAGDGI
jgi:hydroxyacylglutathione hydrolase